MFLNIRKISGSNFATVLRSNFLAKVILTIGGFYLAKKYGTTDFGRYATYLSLSTVISVVISLGLENLSVLTASRESKSLSLNGNLLLIIFLGCIAFFILQIGWPITKSVAGIAGISAFSAVIIAITNSIKLYLSSVNRFRVFSNIILADAVASFIFQVFFYFLKIQNGLILGSFLGFLVAAFWGIFSVMDDIFFVKPATYLQLVRNNIKLVKYTAASNIFNTVGNAIFPILAAVIFSQSLIGVYSMAIKIISVPVLLISTSFASVYYPKASKLFSKNFEEFKKYTTDTVRKNILLAVPLILGLNLAAPTVIMLFFGNKWDGLSLLVFICSFWFLMRCLINPISDSFLILKKNEIPLIFNLYTVFANYLAFFVGLKTKNFSITVLCLSFLMGTGYLILFIYLNSLLKKWKH